MAQCNCFYTFPVVYALNVIFYSGYIIHYDTFVSGACFPYIPPSFRNASTAPTVQFWPSTVIAFPSTIAVFHASAANIEYDVPSPAGVSVLSVTPDASCDNRTRSFFVTAVAVGSSIIVPNPLSICGT